MRASGVEFQYQAQRLIDWCRDIALPVWSYQGLDPSGGFHEALDQTGSPDLEADRRVRVQCRQMYVYAHASCLGWTTEGRRLADHALEYILTHACDGRQGIATLLRADGTVIDASRDLYTHAFFLNGLAWHYRAFGDRSALSFADEIIAYLDTAMGAPHGGWIESLPEARRPRRQNPHMHLFEAFLALAEATGEIRYARYADSIFRLFCEHFHEAASGNIIEYFTDDWRRCPDKGTIVEPGHMMEWSWLTDRYARLTRQNLSALSDQLFDRAMHVGRDADSGFLTDAVDRSGKIIHATRRLWPQTEFIKAAVIKAGKGDMAAQGLATQLIGDFMGTYLNVPVAGLWRDQYDADGGAVPGPAPASSFYHVFSMVSEVHSVCEALELPDHVPAPAPQAQISA